jgi:hypothetical protein
LFSKATLPSGSDRAIASNAAGLIGDADHGRFWREPMDTTLMAVSRFKKA